MKHTLILRAEDGTETVLAEFSAGPASRLGVPENLRNCRAVRVVEAADDCELPYRPGDTFPSLKVFCDAVGTTPPTARRAIVENRQIRGLRLTYAS